MKNQIADLLEDFDQPALLLQAGILLASLLAAMLVKIWVRRRIPEAAGAWKLGVGGFSRMVFPFTALTLVGLSTAALKHVVGGHLALLHLAVPLLVSLALVRLTVYVLRHVFAPGGWLSVWERSIAAVIWIGLALHLTGLLPGIVDGLDEFSFHLGKQRISLLMMLEGAVTIIVSLIVALWLGGEAERKIMKVERMDMNLRVVTAKLTRALLIFAAVLIALPAAGIDLTLLSVFGGALGVGVGLGLQKTASNYFSGFIILLDRSVRIGDLVTVDGHYGTISAITSRYSVVKSPDGTEALIPNETLVTSTVLNHSYTSPEVRLAVPVQVGYDTPVEEAMSLMEQVAKSHPRVLQDPPPKTYLREFGDNGINLELDLWINDPKEGQLDLRSEINLALLRVFRDAGIEIPFPQRDVRIVGGISPEEVAILAEQKYAHEESE